MFLLSILVTIPQNLHQDKGKGKKKNHRSQMSLTPHRKTPNLFFSDLITFQLPFFIFYFFILH